MVQKLQLSPVVHLKQSKDRLISEFKYKKKKLQQNAMDPTDTHNDIILAEMTAACYNSE